MSPANDLVLITGVTGHLGFRTLRYAIDQDYRIRAVVRSQAKASLVKAALARTNTIVKDGQLTFTILTDFLIPGAFDLVLKDITHVIHVASPIGTQDYEPGTDFEAEIVTPAVRMTLNLFEAAKSVPSVKRIVVTSSAAAIVPPTAWFRTIPKVSAEDRTPEIPGPYENALLAYAASKIAALNRAERWMGEHEPHFDVIHIHPTFILGRDDMCTTTEGFGRGTNRLALQHALGTTDPQLPARGPYHNSVHDCAMVHVRALDDQVVVGERCRSFIVSSSGTDGMEWNQANEIVARKFQREVEDGVLPNDGVRTTIPNSFDVRKTEETFRFRHAGFEELVVEVVGHYLEVLREESGEGKS